jgi:hypothetical protein
MMAPFLQNTSLLVFHIPANLRTFAPRKKKKRRYEAPVFVP